MNDQRRKSSVYARASNEHDQSEDISTFAVSANVAETRDNDFDLNDLQESSPLDGDDIGAGKEIYFIVSSVVVVTCVILVQTWDFAEIDVNESVSSVFQKVIDWDN
jgi:hypothetical protein